MYDKCKRKVSYITFEPGELKAVELSADKDEPWGKEEATLINGHDESGRQSSQILI